MLVGRALLAFAAPSLIAAQAATAPSPPSPGRPLMERLDVAFRACAMQLTKPDYLTQKNVKALAAVGIKLDPAPPAQVRAMAERLFAEGGIYASVNTPLATMWLAASPTVPACKVTAADSGLLLTARYDWTTKLRGTAGWTYDRARSGRAGALMRDVLVLNPDRPGGHLIVLLDGPNYVAEDGKGIQLIMTVALENPPGAESRRNL